MEANPNFLKSQITAVFGGTFDPPHFGHVNIVHHVLDNHLASRVLLIPAALPPHKLANALTPFEIRMEMLRLAFLGMESVFISDIESRRLPTPSYTIDTMEAIEQEMSASNVGLALLIGADSLRDLHTWRRATELVARWPILTYPRPGVNLSIEDIARHWPIETAERLHSTLLDLELSPLSSTELRQTAAAGGDISTLTPKPVVKFIAESKLYNQ